MNQAIKTKVSSHKPRRIYVSSLGLSKTLPYNEGLTASQNHECAAQMLVDSLLDRSSYERIISAYVGDNELEAVHIIVQLA